MPSKRAPSTSGRRTRAPARVRPTSTFSLSAETLEVIQAVAEERGLSKSAAVDLLVQHGRSAA